MQAQIDTHADTAHTYMFTVYRHTDSRIHTYIHRYPRTQAHIHIFTDSWVHRHTYTQIHIQM